MEFTVNVQPEQMMEPVWLIIGGCIFLVSVFFFVLLFKFGKNPRKKRVKTPKPPKPPIPPTEAMIRNKAINSIDRIIFELSRGNIDIRESYQRMSMVMRIFVTELTGKDVTALTLTDLEKHGQTKLAELIEKWYAPEFAMKTKADFMGDAKQAKRMVKTWN